MVHTQLPWPPDLFAIHLREDGEQERRGETTKDADPGFGVEGTHGGFEAVNALYFRRTYGGCGHRGMNEKEWAECLLDDRRAFETRIAQWKIAA